MRHGTTPDVRADRSLVDSGSMEGRSMTRNVTDLLADALRLSETERGELAARLIDSLDPTSNEDVEAAWDAEIRERLEDLQTGRVQPIPWSEARRLILDDADESGPA
jgi:putative addiction module component (TIGR02574 family)